MVKEDTLADRIGARMRSRLYEMCRTIEVNAPDFRREARQAGRRKGLASATTELAQNPAQDPFEVNSRLIDTGFRRRVSF